MDNRNVIASSIASNDLACAFSQLVAERWDNWDISPFMVYLVDTCATSALPFLAEQFDVEGLQGFAMTTKEAQQRDMIKRSIALHKYIGTPWAIREACRTIGFPIIVLDEGVTSTPGGNTSSEDWARFRVLVEADMSRRITGDETRKLRLFVEFYKNERSHLVELGFYQLLVDKPLFRTDLEDRDTLDVATLIVYPNPIVMDPSGSIQKAIIAVNRKWSIEQQTYTWSDGSNDQFTINHTGGIGVSEIAVYSDPNVVGDREVNIEIKSIEGQLLGNVTIKQLLNWNAYGRAYCRAYNTFKDNAYGTSYSCAYGNSQLIN